ncbi:alpha/beta hydrolase [Nonomuraea sp. NPDC049750]|uniref:alpha/beta hydrolase n=1 Tax=Nonomuraea sp. NPDC049750 TaxID=3154738 RepID=UPI0033D9FF49
MKAHGRNRRPPNAPGSGGGQCDRSHLARPRWRQHVDHVHTRAYQSDASLTILHTVGDVIRLIDELGENHAVLVGHDWGGSVAWNAALMRPDRVRAVASLSAPYQPRPDRPPMGTLRASAGDNYYSVYVQEPDVADEELARDPRATVRCALYGASADGYPWNPVIPDGGRLLDIWPEPAKLPGWLTEEHINTCATDFERTGFTAALNWFRNYDRNWALTNPWHDAVVQQPALYITGDQDLGGMGQGAAALIAGRPRCLICVRRSCCRVAATGSSRSNPSRSTRH